MTTLNDELDYSNNVGVGAQVSLREAINSCNGSVGADEITFAGGLSGTITLGGTELFIGDSLMITGPGQENLTIDANQGSRALNIEGTSIDVTLSGLTIIGGRTTSSNEIGLPTVDPTHSGGGIRFLSDGTLALTDSTLSGNSTAGARAAGGGIYSSGNVTLTNSTVSGNSTEGGIALGGGISTYGSVMLTNSTLSGNRTAGYRAHGGGISTFSGSVTLTGSTLSGNSTGAADSDGGGLWFNNSEVMITVSTITGNTSAREGGGLGMFADGSDKKLTIQNSIIAGNTATSNPDFTAPNDRATNLEVKSSLIGETAGTSLSDATDGNLLNIVWTTVLESHRVEGVIAPLLAGNGGPTQTVALLSSHENPAIDAGDISLLPSDGNDFDGDRDTSEPIPFDQRGFARVVNLPGIANTISALDIGAFELTDTTPPVFTPPTNTTIEGNTSGGATQAAVLAAALGGATATDDLNPSPTTLLVMSQSASPPSP